MATRELAKSFDPAQVEQRLYRAWMDSGQFRARVDPSRKPFTIMIPPPNVTGILHMGHVLDNTIQDVVIRFRRMQGLEALWQPGTDHAGIATQNVVEKKLREEGTSRKEIGRDAFVERVWKWREDYGGTIIRQLQRLGASVDRGRGGEVQDQGEHQQRHEQHRGDAGPEIEPPPGLAVSRWGGQRRGGAPLSGFGLVHGRR